MSESFLRRTPAVCCIEGVSDSSRILTTSNKPPTFCPHRRPAGKCGRRSRQQPPMACRNCTRTSRKSSSTSTWDLVPCVRTAHSSLSAGDKIPERLRRIRFPILLNCLPRSLSCLVGICSFRASSSAGETGLQWEVEILTIHKGVKHNLHGTQTKQWMFLLAAKGEGVSTLPHNQRAFLLWAGWCRSLSERCYLDALLFTMCVFLALEMAKLPPFESTRFVGPIACDQSNQSSNCAIWIEHGDCKLTQPCLISSLWCHIKDCMNGG